MTNQSSQKQEYQEYFKGMSDRKLIDAFNREVGNSGWTSSRASYLAALGEEFENRNYDYSDIGDTGRLSFKNKVKLIFNKIIVDETN